MPTIMIPMETQRPADMTHQQVLIMYEAGIKVKRIAEVGHVTPSRIYAMLKKAKVQREVKRKEEMAHA